MKKSAVRKVTSKKKAVAKKAVQTGVSDPVVTVLQTTKCKSISEKTNIEYVFSMDENENLMLSIKNTDGGGFWNKGYMSFDSLMSVLSSVPIDQPISSMHLSGVTPGGSVNTRGYVLAACLNENLLIPFHGKHRQYMLDKEGVEKFLAKINKLKSTKG